MEALISAETIRVWEIIILLGSFTPRFKKRKLIHIQKKKDPARLNRAKAQGVIM